MSGRAPDLWSGRFRQDPFPTYARLRAEDPVHLVRGPGGMRTYLITRYEDARAALADPRLSKDMRHAPEWLRRSGFLVGGEGATGANMLNSDPPDHTRQRRLVSKAFTRGRVESLRLRVQEIADELAAALPDGETDLIETFAFPLPVIVICELLGVPAEDRGRLRAWTRAFLTPSLGRAGDRHRGVRSMEEYLSGLIAAARREVDRRLPADAQPSLLHALLSTGGEDGLSGRELLGMIRLLTVAGHETTVNLIGNGLLVLLSEPGRAELLRSRPELLPGAVEELLRFAAPVDRASLRFATENVDLPGGTIPAGAVVSVGIGAANRDPARFPDPDRYDALRGDHGHLSFGHGIHFCLGASLARLEGEIALGTLLRRFPGLALARPPERLRWRAGGASIVRGLESLPVHLDQQEETHVRPGPALTRPTAGPP